MNKNHLFLLEWRGSNCWNGDMSVSVSPVVSTCNLASISFFPEVFELVLEGILSSISDSMLPLTGFFERDPLGLGGVTINLLFGDDFVLEGVLDVNIYID